MSFKASVSECLVTQVPVLRALFGFVIVASTKLDSSFNNCKVLRDT